MTENIDVRIIQEEDIAEELDAAIKDGLVEGFPLDVEHYSKLSWWHSRPKWRTLAQDNAGQVVGHIAVVIRDVLVGKESVPVKVAGIQSVYVCPKMRETGLSDKIMEKTMQVAFEQHLDAGFLFCVPKYEKTYSRMGWQKIDANVLMDDEQGNVVPIPGKNITMIYPLNRKDFPAGDVNLDGPDW